MTDKIRQQAELQGPVTVGWDDTGYDVSMYGATSGKLARWDESG